MSWLFLAGDQLLKGFVAVPGLGWLLPAAILLALLMLAGGGYYNVFHHPLVVKARTAPEALQEFPLPQLAVALRRLRLAQALHEWGERLGLSRQRLTWLQSLTKTPTPSVTTLQTLARLLGMEQAAEIQVLRPNLWLLHARLDYPEPLRGKAVPLFGVTGSAVSGDEEVHTRTAIEQALKAINHPFELPFLLFCLDSNQGRRLIPDGYAALLIDEPVLRELLFAHNPQQTFAGLLLTRGLYALSPYQTEGEVHNPAMFYGRDRLLRELIQAASPQFLLVGPRRVGKTSLLRRLMEQLPTRRPERQIVALNLLGIDDYGRFGRELARRLQLPEPPASGDRRTQAAQIAELLRGKFHDPAKPGLVLIDEADGLVETDAGAGFPLLAELRNLQTEGRCAFILAGYWYLFRRTLDHASPVYNFAPVKRLGPLEPEAGRALTSEPMARLGLHYADPTLPERIVEHTGGYPYLIQLLCDQLLEELKTDRSLTLTAAHLNDAERSQRVRNYVVPFFHFNTGPGAQLLVYRLLEKDRFSLAEAHVGLEQTVDRTIPLGTIEETLVQLVLYGLLVDSNDQYQWAIPLVRNTLLAEAGREHRLTRLLQELPDDFAAWITPSRRP